MKRALIVAPHPDDAELAVAGTISMLLKAKWHVCIVDLTDGEPTPNGTKEIRKKETLQATKLLKIQKRINLNMPNRYLQPTLENRKKLAETIRLQKPDIIFAPAIPDWHPDHKTALELTLTARFQAKYHKTDMKARPHWTPSLWQYYSPHRQDYPQPSMIIDISDYWPKKLEAVKAYQSQLKKPGSDQPNDLLDKIHITARYFGQCINARYGEPFLLPAPIAIKNLALKALT